MHTVIETEAFAKGAKEIGMDEDDVHEILVYISQNPQAGDLIAGTGGARKLRFPLRNKGKSGGVRVITYYAADDIPVFLLDVFAKSDKINLSKKERNVLKSILEDMAQDYRENVKRQIAKVGRAS